MSHIVYSFNFRASAWNNQRRFTRKKRDCGGKDTMVSQLRALKNILYRTPHNPNLSAPPRETALCHWFAIFLLSLCHLLILLFTTSNRLLYLNNVTSISKMVYFRNNACQIMFMWKWVRHEWRLHQKSSRIRIIRLWRRHQLHPHRKNIFRSKYQCHFISSQFRPNILYQ
mgnify:CR=1 FL=1